jgi:hypothetical protein
MNTTIDLSAAEIARRYRALHARQQQAPLNEQWHFGAELRLLRLAHIVAKESEQVRTK